MPSEEVIALDYGDDGRPRRHIWRWVFIVALILAAYLTWAHERTVRDRLRFLYWQRQCMRCVAEPGRPLWVQGSKAVAAIEHKDSDYHFCGGSNAKDWPATAVSSPHCLQRLAAGLPPFLDDDYPIVFLHERVSPSGTRRLVVVRFGPNMDHAQLCSMWAWAITPAAVTHPASVLRQPSVEWVRGWWEGGIRKDKLRFAEADPADPSHFVFRYEHAAMPSSKLDDPDFHESYHANDNKTFVVDGWLRDNGSIDMKARE